LRRCRPRIQLHAVLDLIEALASNAANAALRKLGWRQEQLSAACMTRHNTRTFPQPILSIIEP